jgi:hypothetical protein
MNFKLLAKQAKKAVDKRGGTEALKADLGELQKIAKSEGSLGTKAGKAAAALKEAGAAKKPAAEPADAPNPAAAADAPAPAAPQDPPPAA